MEAEEEVGGAEVIVFGGDEEMGLVFLEVVGGVVGGRGPALGEEEVDEGLAGEAVLDGEGDFLGGEGGLGFWLGFFC